MSRNYIVDPAKIKVFLEKYTESGSKKPYKYQIDDQGRVSITGSIKFTPSFNRTFTELPIQFHEVSESFILSGASLQNLSGCPERVGRNFYCKYMAHLQDLTGGPQHVGSSYYCDDCENLVSLRGAPSNIPMMFSCTNTPLTSLKDGPVSCGSLYISETRLTSLEGAPMTVEDTLDCTDIPTLTSLAGCPNAAVLTLERCDQLHSLAGLGTIQRLALHAMKLTDFTAVTNATVIQVEGFNRLSREQLRHCIQHRIVVTFETPSPPARAYLDYVYNGDYLRLVQQLTQYNATKGLFKKGSSPDQVSGMDIAELT